jgi:hypothetical protein
VGYTTSFTIDGGEVPIEAGPLVSRVGAVSCVSLSESIEYAIEGRKIYVRGREKQRAAMDCG